MAYAYVTGWNNSSNANTITIAPTAGNLLILHVHTSIGGGNPTWTCDDNLASGGYTVALAAANGSSTYRHGAGYKLNVPSGVTTLTFTFNGGNPGEIFIHVYEYSGIATSGAYLGSVRNFQSAPGTGTDALTATALNVSSGVPALVAGCSAHDWSDSTPSAGTGWTSRYSAGARLEDVRATSTGNQTATFTAVNGTLDYCSMAMAFSEAGGGSIGFDDGDGPVGVVVQGQGRQVRLF